MNKLEIKKIEMNESKVRKLNEILVKFRGCVFHFSQNKTPNIMGIFLFFFIFYDKNNMAVVRHVPAKRVGLQFHGCGLQLN